MSRRLTGMTLSGPAGVIRATTLTTDLVGNVLAIGSAAAALARTYIYDDLYRLTSGAGGGRTWAYAYDDGSNLTQTASLGALRYGEGGAPATCLTSAGAEHFTYTPLGQMADTPWGTHPLTQSAASRRSRAGPMRCASPMTSQATVSPPAAPERSTRRWTG